jgi:peptidoglycan/xylan/chitin deacetylase (PgdA/CDA1 family)
VTPEHFAEHLEALRKHFFPIPLQQLVQALQNGKIPRRSVVVTFDDGYADNLHNAKLLLERYDIPATVFVTTGYFGYPREFWWDELERVVLQPGMLPETLYLSINGSAHEWKLGAAVHYDEDACWRHRDWRAWEDAPTPRHSLYYSLWQLLRPLPEDERLKTLDELLTWANADPEGRPTHRTLSLEEVSILGQGELVDVGAHTVTHPMLSTLPAALQRDEIQQSKASLERILGHSVTSFAYPYGDFTVETVVKVRETGFACACSTLANVVERDTERFQLPRIPVQDWDGEEFAKHVSMWLDRRSEQ